MTLLEQLVENALANAEAARRPTRAPTEEDLGAAAVRILNRGWLPVDRDAFRQLCAYMAGPRRLGLLLTGAPGLGKTFFMERVLGLRPVRARDVVAAYTQAQGYNAAFWYDVFGAWDSEQCDRAVVDDLGEEPECVLYGQREEVLANVSARYVARRALALACSSPFNLSARDLDQRYGTRVLDRLREMCFPVVLSGKSNRRREV